MTGLTTSLFVLCVLACAPLTSHAESQGDDYKGVTDPFGDPANYEFAEDEKEDKEFFHLGRYVMLGFDVGVAIFTGGLGRSVDPGVYVGGRLVYFFDKQIGLEAAVHYSHHIDAVRSGTSAIDIDTNIIPITLGLRYYFDAQNAPKAIAIANPYIGFGGGAYIRSQNVVGTPVGFNVTIPSASATHFGAWGGAGIEFPIYRKHVYLGVDVRYHLVFFNDEDDTFRGTLKEGDRGGDYFTTHATITYNF